MVPQIMETAERILREYLSPETKEKKKRCKGIPISELRRDEPAQSPVHDDSEAGIE
jgi:hypothetical protein